MRDANLKSKADGLGSTELATLQRGFSWLPAIAGQVVLRTPEPAPPNAGKT
jgi:hypothetical protein